MPNYGLRRRGKRWAARPYVPGRGHRWAGTFDTEQEATKAAIEVIEREQRLPASKETIESFAKRWVSDYPRPKESTNDRYRADAARFARVYGSKRLADITVPMAREYAGQHRHDLGGLRAMFSDARREGLVLDNPFFRLGFSKGKGRSGISPITQEELQTLGELAVAAHGEYGHTFRAIIVFAAYVGLRPGELFGLDWSDIDYEAEKIHVRQQFHKRRLTLPKSSKTRKVFLPPQAVEALRSMPTRVPRPRCRYSKTEHLFLGKEDQRISQGALTSYWKPIRVAFEAGLAPERQRELQESSQSGKAALDFYALRHFCATFLVEQGVESWIVARQLGHEDGGRLVEKTYGHPRDEVADQRLKQAFGGNVAPLRAVDDDAEAANG